MSKQKKSEFKQGEALSAVWGPLDAEGDAAGGSVDFRGVTGIHVSQAMGPMGFYDVAVIESEDGKNSVMPLHMAEIIKR